MLAQANIITKIYNNLLIRSVHIDNNSDTLLVFVHGALGGYDAFQSFLEDNELEGYNLLAYDRPSYGSSIKYPVLGLLLNPKFYLT